MNPATTTAEAPSPAQRPVRRWSLVVLGLVAATGLRAALQPWLGASYTLVFYYPVLIALAAFVGWREAALGTGLAAALAVALFMPAGSIAEPGTWLALAVFGGAQALLIGVIDSLRSQRRRAEAARREADARTAEARALAARLEESEAHFRHLFESSPQAPWVAGPRGRLLDVGPRWLEWTGTTREQALEGSPAALVHPEDRALVDAAWAQAIEGGGDFVVEHRVRTADGSWRWMRSVARARRDASGRVERWYGVTEDVDARRRAVDELRAAAAELEERRRALDAVLTAVPDFLYAFDVRGRVVFANQRLLDLWSRPPGEAIGRSLRELDYPADVEQALLAGIEHVLRTGTTHHSVTHYTSPAGLDGWYENLLAPVRDAAGRIVWVAGSSRDVTARHVAEQQLAAQRRSLERALDVETIGVVFFRPSGRILQVNDAFCRMSGWPRERLMADDFDGLEITPPEWIARSVAAVQEFRAEGRVPPYEKEYLRPDGTRWWALVTAARVDDDEAVEFTIDVSERKLAEARLIEADRRKDEFIATLSHELRNPLAPIRHAAGLLRGAARLPAERLERAGEIIERQVSQLARLLDDLLDISRITQGKLALRLRRVSIEQVVASALESVRPYLEARGHRLELRLPEGGAVLDADPIRLTQVIANLLHNAARYTPPGGHLELLAEREAAWLRIVVRDDGIGLAPEALGRIFDMFAQVHEADGRGDGGLGIGLALVRGLVALHGGSVEARSDGPGRGSEFVVRLPLSVGRAEVAPLPVPANGPARVTAPAPAADAAAGVTARRVLVADDNVDAADSMAMLLQLAGHEVRVAYCGSEALALARELRPEVLLLDIGMPDLDGCEVARAVRALPWGAEATLVALTGYGQESDRRRSLEAGFDDHLTKPVEADELLARLAQLAVRRAAGGGTSAR